MIRTLHLALALVAAASFSKPLLPQDTASGIFDAGALNLSHDTPNRAHISCDDLAVEDGWSLRLQQDPSQSLLILASLGDGETGGIRMAMARGYGYKRYLVDQMGVDPKRIFVYANATFKGETHAFLIDKNANYDSLVQGYAPMVSFAPGPNRISFCSSNGVSNAKTSTPFSNPTR